MKNNYFKIKIKKGIIDINVNLNSFYDKFWQDTENITKMAIQGGVTTLIDNPIMNYIEKNSENPILSRINSLKDCIYTDCGILAYIDDKNFKNIENYLKIDEIIGFKFYMAPCLQNDIEYLNKLDLSNLKKILKNLKEKIFLCFDCVCANERDMFLVSPLRSVEKSIRLDNNYDIKDLSKFGGGISESLETLNLKKSDIEKEEDEK